MGRLLIATAIQCKKGIRYLTMGIQAAIKIAMVLDTTRILTQQTHTQKNHSTKLWAEFHRNPRQIAQAPSPTTKKMYFI